MLCSCFGRFIRTIVTTQTTTCVFLTKGGRATPLHNVIDMALACFHRTLVWDLPDIVQLVIDSGGYVHDRHTNGLTALQCLMDMVHNMLISLLYEKYLLFITMCNCAS